MGVPIYKTGNYIYGSESTLVSINYFLDNRITNELRTHKKRWNQFISIKFPAGLSR